VAISSGKVAELIGEISAASNEQAQGIGQVSKAVSEMDKVVQQNAANAEESASAAEEMNAQAETMKGIAETLGLLVGTNLAAKSKNGGSPLAPAKTSATRKQDKRIALPAPVAVAKMSAGSRKNPAGRGSMAVSPNDSDFKDF
jgi:methyl-accepting chemotaxis protein